MNKRSFLRSIGAGMAAGAAWPGFAGPNAARGAAAASDCELRPGAIQHMVIFSLKHGRDSKAASAFLEDGRKVLSAIPGVNRFQVYSQVSKKNDYDFGFSMVFSGRGDYDRYNNHPDHVSFVEKHWKTEVSRFLEIDFQVPS